MFLPTSHRMAIRIRKWVHKYYYLRILGHNPPSPMVTIMAYKTKITVQGHTSIYLPNYTFLKPLYFSSSFELFDWQILKCWWCSAWGFDTGMSHLVTRKHSQKCISTEYLGENVPDLYGALHTLGVTFCRWQESDKQMLRLLQVYVATTSWWIWGFIVEELHTSDHKSSALN